MVFCGGQSRLTGCLLACSEDQGTRAEGQEQAGAAGSGAFLRSFYMVLCCSLCPWPTNTDLLLWLLLCLQLNELKTELAALRVAKVTGGAPNKLSKM